MKSKLNSSQISKLLDIVEPFLMIDLIDELIPGRSAIGYKRILNDSWFMRCHITSDPVMPGTLITESMLQTLAVIIYSTDIKGKDVAYINEIKTKIFKKVDNKCTLKVHAELGLFKRGVAKGKATCFIGDDIISTGSFLYYSPQSIEKI